MVEHSRVWSADDPNSPFADGGGAFKFAVLDAAEVIQKAQENFVEEQAQAWRDVRQWADDQMDLVETQAGGSPNGPGASLPLTENLREQLPGLWLTHNIHTVLDIACGDWNWMRYVDLTGIKYTGWDIDGELIKRCALRAGERTRKVGPYRPAPHFAVRNCQTAQIPEVDCILARHILIHFPNDYVSMMLDRFRDSGSTYLLASHFPNATNDFIYDPTRYAWIGYMERPVNLMLPPFSLSNKVDFITEQTGPAGVLTEPHELALFKL